MDKYEKHLWAEKASQTYIHWKFQNYTKLFYQGTVNPKVVDKLNI